MGTFDLSGIGMTSQRTRDRLVKRLADNGIDHDEVLTAVASVPRHIFIDEALAHRAYEDTALPIGHGQTISQPFIVALMTQSLLNRPRPRVLEVGTGSGYQTAVLASLPMLVEKVYTIERIDLLIERAQERLRAMRCGNVRFKHGDGYQGWPKESPFDGILVTAAPRSVPDALLDQLAMGGRMVVPVGDGSVQELKVYDRNRAGFDVETVEYVRFVPLLKGVR
ncbi:MAG: protein-L-isoaspartate(D-aspartate) O-methyltransferase [Gammaproteobacteria bacterium]|nr:protein-L-isoaspartate(D-aspartate) O-methyltransferase [Gammaproteobacteria bacterium]